MLAFSCGLQCCRLQLAAAVQLHDIDNDTGVIEEERVSPALVSSRHALHIPHRRRHRATGTPKMLTAAPVQNTTRKVDGERVTFTAPMLALSSQVR